MSSLTGFKPSRLGFLNNFRTVRLVEDRRVHGSTHYSHHEADPWQLHRDSVRPFHQNHEVSICQYFLKGQAYKSKIKRNSSWNRITKLLVHCKMKLTNTCRTSGHFQRSTDFVLFVFSTSPQIKKLQSYSNIICIVVT